MYDVSFITELKHVHVISCNLLVYLIITNMNAYIYIYMYVYAYVYVYVYVYVCVYTYYIHMHSCKQVRMQPRHS